MSLPDIILNIHNLGTVRDLNRVGYLLQSLMAQEKHWGRLIVVCSGEEAEMWDIEERVGHFTETIRGPKAKVKLEYLPLPAFNKPKAINQGAKISKSEWLIFTDADYLFVPGMLQVANLSRNKDKMLLKQVECLPEGFPVNQLVSKWDLAPKRLHKFAHGEAACGGFMYHHRDFFKKSGGLDENMAGHGGMDEDYVNRAKNAGMQIEWLKEGRILHQWHPISKMRLPEQKRQTKQNWRKRNINQIKGRVKWD